MWVLQRRESKNHKWKCERYLGYGLNYRIMVLDAFPTRREARNYITEILSKGMHTKEHMRIVKYSPTITNKG